ncbi:MAG TPA: cellulose biosynthesis protein CelD, partial [Acetobacteraceae bacterium]
MTGIAVSPVTDFAALEDRWRALEARANGSFFQGWTWTGCLAEERFADPMLVEAREDGRTVALALFNRQRSRLRSDAWFLGESGIKPLDTIYIEHNGVLADAGREQALGAA